MVCIFIYENFSTACNACQLKLGLEGNVFVSFRLEYEFSVLSMRTDAHQAKRRKFLEMRVLRTGNSYFNLKVSDVTGSTERVCVIARPDLSVQLSYKP